MAENTLALIENTLQAEDYDVTVTQGSINFPQYQELLLQAENLAEYLEKTVVTADTIQTNKKILAAINKGINNLEHKRKEIKKVINEPYTEFEVKVKEIVNTIRNSQDKIKEQIKDFELQEKEDKLDRIKELFNSRVKNLDYSDNYKFDRFMNAKYLNKSTSFSTIEQELGQFILQTQTDLQVISNLEGTLKDFVSAEYINTDRQLNSIIAEGYQYVDSLKKYKETVTETEEKKKKVAEENGVEYKGSKKEYIFIFKSKEIADFVYSILEKTPYEYEYEVR